jgi:hypothetical protein
VWKQLNSGNNFETIKNWIGKHWNDAGGTSPMKNVLPSIWLQSFKKLWLCYISTRAISECQILFCNISGLFKWYGISVWAIMQGPLVPDASPRWELCLHSIVEKGWSFSQNVWNMILFIRRFWERKWRRGCDRENRWFRLSISRDESRKKQSDMKNEIRG